MPADLRDWIAKLNQENLLITVNEPVDIDYTSAIAVQNSGKAVLFTRVNGYEMPLLINSISTKRMVALALGCEEDQINSTYLLRIGKGVKPKLVDTAPCKEVILKGDQVDITKLPIPFQHEFDAAPFISAPVQFARDPETGELDMGMYRMMYRKRNETSFDMTLHNKLWFFLHKTMEQNKNLEVACVVGLHGTDLLASVVKSNKVPEIEILGSLKGEPAEMVKCETIDVEVPSNSEIVLEGELLADGWKYDEGPYGEYTGAYGEVNKNPIFRVKAITHRKDAIFQSVTIGYNPGVPFTDQAMIILPMVERNAIEALVRAGIEYSKVRYISNTILVVSIKKKKEDDGIIALNSILRSVFLVKYCIVFDDDVDIFDDWVIFQALTTRTKPADDCIVLSDMQGSALDPLTGHGGITSKMGIDATISLGAEKFFFLMPKAPHMDVVMKTKVPAVARAQTFTDQDVTRLAMTIYEKLEKPKFFFDIQKEFPTANYRALLLAWGKLREKELVTRDSRELGIRFVRKPSGTETL